MDNKRGSVCLKDVFTSVKARDYKKGIEQVGNILKDVETYVRFVTVSLTVIAKFGKMVGRRPSFFEATLDPFKRIGGIAKQSK